MQHRTLFSLWNSSFYEEQDSIGNQSQNLSHEKYALHPCVLSWLDSTAFNIVLKQLLLICRFTKQLGTKVRWQTLYNSVFSKFCLYSCLISFIWLRFIAIDSTSPRWPISLQFSGHPCPLFRAHHLYSQGWSWDTSTSRLHIPVDIHLACIFYIWHAVLVLFSLFVAVTNYYNVVTEHISHLLSYHDGSQKYKLGLLLHQSVHWAGSFLQALQRRVWPWPFSSQSPPHSWGLSPFSLSRDSEPPAVLFLLSLWHWKFCPSLGDRKDFYIFIRSTLIIENNLSMSRSDEQL